MIFSITDPKGVSTSESKSFWTWERNFEVNVFHSSVIRQKGESQTGVSRKQNTPNFPKNEHFLPPDTQTRCSFFGKFGVFCFLETPVLRFALFPSCRHIGVLTEKLFKVCCIQNISRKVFQWLFRDFSAILKNVKCLWVWNRTV